MSPLSGFTVHEGKLRKWLSYTVIALAAALVVLLGRTFTNEHDARITAEMRAVRVVESSPVCTIMCSADRKITIYNPAAEAIFGWTSAEMLGQPIDKLVLPEVRDRHDLAFDVAVARLKLAKQDWEVTRRRLPIKATTKDGRVIDLIMTVRGIRYAGRIEFIAVIVDPHSTDSPMLGSPLERTAGTPSILRDH